MNNTARITWMILSFVLPLMGVIYYMVYSPKKEARLFGFVAMVGIFVYLSVGIIFL